MSELGEDGALQITEQNQFFFSFEDSQDTNEIDHTFILFCPLSFIAFIYGESLSWDIY